MYKWKSKENLNRSGQQKQFWKAVNNLHISNLRTNSHQHNETGKHLFGSTSTPWGGPVVKREAKPDHKLSHDHPDLVKTTDMSRLDGKVALWGKIHAQMQKVEAPGKRWCLSVSQTATTPSRNPGQTQQLNQKRTQKWKRKHNLAEGEDLKLGMICWSTGSDSLLPLAPSGCFGLWFDFKLVNSIQYCCHSRRFDSLRVN